MMTARTCQRCPAQRLWGQPKGLLSFEPQIRGGFLEEVDGDEDRDLFEGCGALNGILKFSMENGVSLKGFEQKR